MTTPPSTGNRNDASITFVGFLIGLAYSETADVIGSTMQGQSSWPVVACLLTFFLLGLNSFLGGYFTLAHPHFRGLKWFTNFALLITESVILIGMAACLNDETFSVKLFSTYVVAYYLIEAGWAFYVYMSRRNDPIRRRTIRPEIAANTLPFPIAIICWVWIPFSPEITASILLATVVVAFSVTVALSAKGGSFG